MNYVISKATRTPMSVSYNGPSWDRAGLRHLRKDVYYSLVEAEALARLLTEVNPVGFVVSEVPEVV